MAFYGLSNALWRGEDVTGDALATAPLGYDYNALAEHYDGISVTMTPGDSFVIASYGPEFFDRDPVITDSVDPIAWVLEVDAASSGSVTMSAGISTGSDFGAVYCTESLGSFDCTGQKVVVAPQTSYGLADFLDSDKNANVLISCTSGTVVLKQVKVRVWPTGGPHGAWKPTGSFSETGSTTTYSHEFVMNTTDQIGYAAAYAENVAAFNAVDGALYTDESHSTLVSWKLPSVSYPGAESYFYITDQFASSPFEPAGWISVKSIATYPRPKTLQFSTDPTAGYDPRETATEAGAQVRAVGGGPVIGQHTSWNGAVWKQGNAGWTMYEHIIFNPGPTVPFNQAAQTASSVSHPIHLAAAAEATITPDGVGPFVITCYPDAYFAGAPSVDVVDFASGKWKASAPSNVVTYAPHEVFDPSLPWVPDTPPPTGSGIIPGWVEVFGSTGGGGGGGTGTSLLSDGGPCIDCGRLGVGEPRVFLYDRGGTRRIAEITQLATVRWTRVRDDISSATVIVNSPSRECCAILAALSVGRHEIVIFRDNDRVWEGPLTRVSWKASTVEITAHDICHYISRTIMRSAYDNRYAKKNSRVGPVTTRAQVILQNELKRKEALTPAYNILRFLDVRTHEKTTHTSRFTPPYYSSVWEEMDYMAARLSLDYTTIGRRLIINDVHDVIGRSQMLTDKDFSDELIVTSYGMELATRSAVTDGEGHWAAVGGTDPYYGEVELLNNTYGEEVRPENPTAPTKAELAALAREMASQAQRNLAGRYPIPTVVRIPDNTQLDPSAPICINGLVPGIRVPIRTTLACLDLSQEQKLDSVTASWDASGEKVAVTLSPAPGTTPWDDESESSEED